MIAVVETMLLIEYIIKFTAQIFPVLVEDIFHSF